MRNFKKFLALVMATLMILSAAVITTGAADSKADYTEAAQHLVAIKVMKGDEKGNLMLDNGVTRYQAALFFAQATSGETAVETWNAEKKSGVFTDVKDYGTAIDYAYTKGIIAGRGNGIFDPDGAIIYQDMLVMAVRALGYETKDMAYPYGYILAAQKLDLDADVENVNFKAALTRGETSQIIWNMLNTEIAVEDPLSGKILYPGDKGMAETLLDKGKIERTTMLVDAGFASDEIAATIVEFNEADDKDKDDVDTVTIKSADLPKGFKIAAADLGITADTPKVEYLGRDVTLFIDCAAKDFEKDYDVIADDSDAAVVYADFEEYTVVENLGNAGNIKWDEDGILTLNGSKFKNDGKAYNINLYLFTKNGWEKQAKIDELTDNFKYDSKDGYNGDKANSYGKVEYYVIDGAKGEADTLNVYYTEYEFGQYFSRTIKYQPTSKDATFVSIGHYTATKTKNFDGDDTYFKEQLVSSNYTITDSTKTISKSNGKDAMEVKLAGETIKSGDFMFYDYYEVDNILTVAQVGTFKEGRLTSYNSAKETVKIDGTNKTVAFKGAFDFQFKNDNTLCENYDAAIKGYITNLKSGKNNVKYIELDGNVVYMEETSSSSNNDENSFDFIIATTDIDKMTDLLDMKADKYNDKLTEGLYIDDNGYAAIAVLDTATGKWKLASVKNFYFGDFDGEDVEFDSKIDLGESAKYYEMIGSTYNKKADYESSRDALNGGAIFFVINEKDGVYDLAAAPDYNKGSNTYPTLIAGTNTTGLVFSDTVAKTNKIRANDDDDEARVALNNETVLVVIDGNKVGVRTGVQKESRSIELADNQKVYFLAANSSLIVMDMTGATVKDTTVLDNYWGGSASTATANETYYVVLADYSVEVNALEDDKYEATMSNLFDLKEMKVVNDITVSIEKGDIKTVQGYAAGELLHLTDTAEIEKATGKYDTVVKAAKYLADKDEANFVDFTGFDFADADTITAVLDGATKYPTEKDATKINVKVVTIDAAGIDKEDYAFDSAIVTDYDAVKDAKDKYEFDVATMEDFKDGKAYYTYTLGEDAVTEITEPADGIFDNFVVKMAGKTILVPGADEDYSEYANLAAFMAKGGADYKELTVEVSAYAEYDANKGTLDMVVFKLVEAK